MTVKPRSQQAHSANQRRQPRTDAHYSVYVVELSRDVLNNRPFVRRNPNHDPLKPCVYVGMTGIDPEERFKNHKRGYRASRYPKRYGLRLLKELFEHLNPMTHDQARIKEIELAQNLQDEGYAVWHN